VVEEVVVKNHLVKKMADLEDAEVLKVPLTELAILEAEVDLTDPIEILLVEIENLADLVEDVEKDSILLTYKYKNLTFCEVFDFYKIGVYWY
jgi:hypothetical protein